MKIKERLIDAFLGGLIETKVKERLQAASSGDPNDPTNQANFGWRKLTGNTDRKLPITTPERAQEISYWLWKTNPLANWIIEITVAFVVGNGFKIEAKNPDIQKLINDFWNHPINNMPIYLEKYARELGIYGEQFWPKFVSENAGKVILGYVDPVNIKEVVTDPENCKIIIAVVRKGTNDTEERKYKTVLPSETEDFLSEEAKAYRDGCDAACFFFAINNVTNDPRGTSDIFVTADWLDAYEQFLFDYSDKWPLLNTFVWDLLVEGGDTTAINEQIKAFTKKSGSVYGHNEKVKLEASTPDLKAVDAKEGASIFRNHILGNRSIPEFWYGGGGDANKAIAMEMGAPAYKMMSSRQQMIIYIVKCVLDDVIREADAHGMLKGVPEDERTYSFNVEELATKDITKLGAAIQQLTGSLVSGVTQELIDKDTAVKFFAFCLGMVGYEIDIDAVKTALNGQDENKGFEDYTKGSGQGSGAGGQ